MGEWLSYQSHQGSETLCVWPHFQALLMTTAGASLICMIELTRLWLRTHNSQAWSRSQSMWKFVRIAQVYISPWVSHTSCDAWEQSSISRDCQLSSAAFLADMTVLYSRTWVPKGILTISQGLVIAGLADVTRPAEKLSFKQSGALAATGVENTLCIAVLHTYYRVSACYGCHLICLCMGVFLWLHGLHTTTKCACSTIGCFFDDVAILVLD